VTDKAEEGRRGSYFFLSYAHSPPLAGNHQADPDQWVRRFFRDLTASVTRHATPRSALAPGFFDQEIPVGSDWKASLNRALGAAEVFVPLYSPGYFARSWPGREWACFHRRLVMAGLDDPVRRFAPVLWIPLPGEQDRPALREALAVGASQPDYAENGLRALLRLKPYRGVYRDVVDRLARRIVELAEGSPLEPSPVPDIDATESAFLPEAAPAVFAVTVAAPTAGAVPAGGDPSHYGERSQYWRPFPRQQELSLAAYAAGVAERLDFAVMVTGIEKTGDLLSSRPGIILIDPWFIAEDRGLRMLRSFVQGLPSWVLPLLVLEPPHDARAARLAKDVRDILDAAGAVRTEAAHRAARGVGSLEEFVSIMPALIAEAERQYLRHGPVPTPAGPPGARPRLGGAARPSTPNSSPRHPGEQPDD
jgi:FxsC-like protein